jgi:predicted ATPase
MIERIRLKNFKNFRDAELALGKFTVLVGTNASGKSNLRDAFQFLHGVGRQHGVGSHYTLADILGEVLTEGWSGIRGAPREVAYRGEAMFGVEVRLRSGILPPLGPLTYNIEVDVGTDGQPPRVVRESLDGFNNAFTAVLESADSQSVRVELRSGGKSIDPFELPAYQPVLTQLVERSESSSYSNLQLRLIVVIQEISSMRFFELDADAMRRPSIPGQNRLGSRGENLSSVLRGLSSPARHTLVEFVKELTPMDVSDFEFPPDPTGKVLLMLVENGHKTSAYSASDGTLRLLGVLAVLLGYQGPAPSSLCFIEELEDGIHPTRLYLLLDFIEQRTAATPIQVVATSHSPQLLGFLREDAREHAALVYRLSGQPDARVRRIVDIPEAARLLKSQGLTKLHSSGWFEDAVEFLEREEGDA